MPEPVRVVVSGASGRMGRSLAALAAEDAGVLMVGGLDREGAGAAGYAEVRSLPDAAELLRQADVVIDFSAPAFLRQLLDLHGDALVGRGLVVGTTGLEPADERALEQASRRLPVLTAANFSVGVNLLLALAARAASALGDAYDVEIVETHHRRKEDAPSGTALALAESVAEAHGRPLSDTRRDGRSGRPGARPTGEIGLHAVRGGGVVGEHEVRFLGEMDQVTLVHRATDRALFAQGALRAARWIAGRPAGRYGMREVLGLQ